MDWQQQINKNQQTVSIFLVLKRQIPYPQDMNSLAKPADPFEAIKKNLT